MEHNLENFFREKITTAERKSVTWNKQHTWQRIEVTLTPERKSRRFAYAAACVLVILTFAGIHSRNHSATTMDPGDLAASASNRSDHPAIEKECEIAIQPVIQQAIQKSIAPKPGKEKQPQITEKALNDSTGIDELLITEQELLTEIKHQESPDIVQAVEPIIGVIIPEKQKSNVVTEKKVRFRLFRAPEKSLSETPDGDIKTLFARIN